MNPEELIKNNINKLIEENQNEIKIIIETKKNML